MMLTLRDYRRRKQERFLAEIPPRGLCYVCWRPLGFCYCGKIRPVFLDLKFAILIHPIEEKRPIATGRMAHLCLKNSTLLEGDNYTNDPAVNEMLNDPTLYPVILYPGEGSTDLSALSLSERRALFPKDRRPVVLVIDGTWNSARRTMNRSRNLKKLPQIRFTPPTPSRIRVRRQPEEHCYTTLEAIHHVIDLLEPPGASVRSHDNLLEVLDYMVGLQLKFSGEGKRRDEGPRTRKAWRSLLA